MELLPQIVVLQLGLHAGQGGAAGQHHLRLLVVGHVERQHRWEGIWKKRFGWFISLARTLDRCLQGGGTPISLFLDYLLGL